jgi:hypothetical protein
MCVRECVCARVHVCVCVCTCVCVCDCECECVKSVEMQMGKVHTSEEPRVAMKRVEMQMVGFL